MSIHRFNEEFSNNFQKYCHKHGISCGILLNDREREHMNQCRVCQQTWPLYYYYNRHLRDKPDTIINKAWLIMPESKRVCVCSELTKVVTKHLKSLVYDRPPSAYQVFLKHARSEYAEVREQTSFGNKTKAIAKLWKGLDDDTKDKYKQQSLSIKQGRKELENQLPMYMKIYVQKLRSTAKNNRKSHKRKSAKKLNGFMLYLRDRWKDEEQSELTYRQVMKIASHEWNHTLSNSIKYKYNNMSTDDH